MQEERRKQERWWQRTCRIRSSSSKLPSSSVPLVSVLLCRTGASQFTVALALKVVHGRKTGWTPANPPTLFDLKPSPEFQSKAVSSYLNRWSSDTITPTRTSIEFLKKFRSAPSAGLKLTQTCPSSFDAEFDLFVR
ncbi:hypothetical protein MVEN_00142200 [Mycena venus]|uniref:Uncharacterized protein n=1 Tax=Mycena venus TaxID=2733690 RepID=A0A8H6YW71_9AGAR|nr:hypothetical protein MVEN_00142200 [Mycena venus]